MNRPLFQIHFVLITLFLPFSISAVLAQSISTTTHSGTHIIDSRHYSREFGEVRNFRIFLPPAYFTDTEKRYPVIYFFHGWSQRYFGPVGDDYSNYDQGQDNEGDNIANYVAENEVIVVKVDGYNGEDLRNYDLSPYNIGPPESFRQFPIYFPDLVDHIDAAYRTLADRNHRAISGLSMGGFMTFWISGKYPHLVSAAGNFCGSPEFYAGPRKFPVEYRNMDMFNNYGGVNVRMHYGDKDNLRFYHQDMNRVWCEVMDNYEFKVFDARHSTCGLGEMFDFILETFEDPPELPGKWDHIDVYPEFSVWDWKLSSDRFRPGFTILEEVNSQGFKSTVREFLPDGPVMPYVNLTFTTPPVYEKNKPYIINKIDIEAGHSRMDTILSDDRGRLKINVTGSQYHVGINDPAGAPNMGLASFRINSGDYAVNGRKLKLYVDLLNKGTQIAEDITLFLTSFRDYVNVSRPDIQIAEITPGQIGVADLPFEFIVEKEGVEIAKFKLSIKDKTGREWKELFEVPLKDDVGYTDDFVIADGSEFTVARSGIDSAKLSLGKGNGDGIANPGETVVILARDQGRYWRTEAESKDPYVNPFGIKLRESDNWAGYDRVNGSEKITMPVIASDCPDNHEIEFYISYWMPVDRADYSRKIVKKKVRIRVSGLDTTPPALLWASVSGDNAIEIKLYDGSQIEQVTARLIPVHDTKGLDYVYLIEPERDPDIRLEDKGRGADRVPGDFVFTRKVPPASAYFYKLEIESIDIIGNKSIEYPPDVFLIH